jgi:hypothetical protein
MYDTERPESVLGCNRQFFPDCTVYLPVLHSPTADSHHLVQFPNCSAHKHDLPEIQDHWQIAGVSDCGVGRLRYDRGTSTNLSVWRVQSL